MASHCVTGIPSTRTSPSVGATRRLIILRQVVLPDPLRPSNIRVSPRPMERFTPDTRALLSETRKVTSANSMAVLESLMARVAPAYQKLSFDRRKCAHKHECRSQSSDDQLRQISPPRSCQVFSGKTLVASVTATAATTRAATATAATAAAPVTAAPAATAALATRPVHLRTSFVNGQIAPAEIRAVQGFHRFAGRLVIDHLDEGKSARLSRVAISDNADLFDWAIGLEQRAHLVFSRIEC